MKRRPPMRRRLGDYFARVLSGRSAKRPTFEPMGLRRLRTEPLEDRRMLSVGTSYVDDTLAITNDIGDPGLSPGDTVTYAAGEAGEQTGLIYGTDAFDSIQDAVDATDTGGTVNVATGLYAEGVTVGKNLTFDGATGTASDVVIQPISGDGFTLASNQVTIRDLKITGAYNAIAGDGANGASALSLDNVELVDNLHDGVTLSNAGSFDATDLVVTGNDGYGCDLSFLTGDVTLTRVTIDGNDDGLRIWDFGSVTISDSSISDNEYQGIQIDYGAGDAVLSNVTANNNRSDNASVDVTGSVTITNGSFNGSVYFDGGGMVDGGGDGLDITSDAGVTLVNVTAYGNYGQNLEIGAEGSVYITNGSFDNSYNYGGIEIDTSYANTTSEVVLTNVTANDNWGQNLRISGGISVLIDGGSFDNSTDYGGVIVQVYGDVTMIDVSADGNYDENLSVWYASSLTVTNGSFNASIRDEGLKLCGIDGNVTLTNVVSNGSYDQNLVLDPLENILFDPITGEPLFDPETGEFIIVLVQADSVTITDSSFNGSLTDEGIQIEGVEGALTLTNVTSNGNNDEAAEITMAGSVIVNGGSFSDSTTLPGIVLNSVTTGLISGAAIENNPIGIYVGPGSATAIVGNSIVGTGLSTAIDVESGTAMIEGNDLGGNMIGLLVRSDGTTPAVVDAGQLAGGTDFTGLGISTGGNDFSAYTTSDALSGAVVNLNADTLAGPQGAPTDVTALGNTWYSADPLQIEAAIYHDPDDVSGLIAYVDYAVLSDLNIATSEESGITTLTGSFTDDPQTHEILVDWGDGATDVITLAQGVWTFDVTHEYTGGGGGGASVDDAVMEVEENTPNGTLVGTVTGTGGGAPTINVTVTDALGDTIDAELLGGGGPLTYSIIGGTGATAFTIDPTTAEITVADETELDYETVTSLELLVEGNDGAGGTDTATVTINLLNLASIEGTVYVDTNENGLFDANEMGIDGVTVELLDASGNPVVDGEGNPITSITTEGYYLFEDLAPGTYQIHELQPTGVDDGLEALGSLSGSIPANDTMQLALERVDASDYVFAEIGQSLASGDVAGIGFWQNWHGQALIAQGGTSLAQWLTTNFSNVFGDEFVGADGTDVATFYKDQLFRQKGNKSKGPAKVDANFMSLALATFFTSNYLAGDAATAYGFNVTDTGIGTKIVNVGDSGAAFGVADNTDLTIMQVLWATNDLTDMPDNETGFAHIYDTNGDGEIDATEAWLRKLAHDLFAAINSEG